MDSKEEFMEMDALTVTDLDGIPIDQIEPENLHLLNGVVITETMSLEEARRRWPGIKQLL